MFGQVLEPMAKFNLLKTRTSIDIFSTEKCKVTFGLKYIFVMNAHTSLLFVQLMVYLCNKHVL